MWRDIERRADWYGLPNKLRLPLQAFDQAKDWYVLNQQGKHPKPQNLPYLVCIRHHRLAQRKI